MGLNEVGCRIIFDQDGEIIHIIGEAKGDILERKNIEKLYHIDLEYGAIDLLKYNITGIDMITMQPIIEAIEVPITEEEIRIKELEEDIKLLQADANLGGLL